MPKRKDRKVKAKTRKVTPTLKQKLAADKLLEIIGNSGGQGSITMGRILKEAGYAPSVVKNPQLVTRSKGWQKLTEEYFSDEDVVSAHGNALDAQRIEHYTFPKSQTNESIKKLVKSFGFQVAQIERTDRCKRAYCSVPDHAIRMAAVKEAYKVKGKYPTGKHKVEGEIIVIEKGWGVEKGDRDRD